MADINYNNPEAINPGLGWKPDGFLGGMLYGQDRSRYENQASLQDMMNVNKAKDYFKEEPVRATKRSADVQTNLGTINTAQGMAQEGLRSKQLENRFNEGTLGARMGQKIVESQKAEHDFNLQKMQQGMQLSTMMVQAMGQYGPAGAAAVVEKLKGAGIDVSNDPVVKYVMAGTSHEDMSARVQQVQQAFNSADQAHRTALMKEQYQTARGLLEANSRVDAAYARTAQEKAHDIRWQAYQDQVKLEHPDWDGQRIRAEAVKRMDAAQYGAQKPQDYEERDTSKVVSELEQLTSMLDPNTPIAKQIKDSIQKLKNQSRTRGPQPGTAENPIPLR